MMNQNSRNHRIRIVLALCSALLCSMFFCGCGKEEEVRMGRYGEREIPLNNRGFSGMYPLEDGGLAFYGGGDKMLLMDDQHNVQSRLMGWYDMAGIYSPYLWAVSPKKEVILAYTAKFYMGEEEQIFIDTGFHKYLFVDEEGRRHALAPYGEGYEPYTDLEYFTFAPDGRLYVSDGRGKMYRLDTQSGELTFLFDTEITVNETIFYGDIMLALNNHKAFLYDVSTDTMLEDNAALNDFVESHQTDGKSIVLALEETEAGSAGSGTAAAADGETEGILYLGCRTGIYRYVWDGAVIEQIADGRFLSFGDGVSKPVAMRAYEDGTFLVFFTGDKLMEMYYDETLPARPEKELSVYSLEEDDRIRYAAQLLQKHHPEVLVNYETGIEGDYAMSREDALKNLNTRILSGECPDVLILDGMDIEQYVKKGILKNLDGFLAPYLEEGDIYEGIVDGMRMGETDSVYALPMSVKIPLWLCDEEYGMADSQSLADLVDVAAAVRGQHPAGTLFVAVNEEHLLNQMAAVCVPAWTQEDGSLDSQALMEFYQSALELWQLELAGRDAETEKLLHEYAQEEYFVTRYMKEGALPAGYYGYPVGGESAQFVFGTIRDIYHDGTLLRAVVCCNEFYHEDLEKGIYTDYLHLSNGHSTYGALQGQARNVFLAQSIVGISGQAKEPALAEDFLALLLSDEMMDKFWLNWGLPITRSAMESELDVNNHEFAILQGHRVDLLQNDLHWPNAGEQDRLRHMMEQLDTAYFPHSILEEEAVTVGVRVLQGELTPEEGVEEVEKKMAIALSE